MATFSLLQLSLDQTIARESLEEASAVLPSVAIADCALLQRDLFGIVVSNLPFDEALAFQVELKRRGFPTEVVADRELPVLHEPFTIQRIEIQKTALLLTDAMGRQQTRPLEELVFVAGGMLTRSKTRLIHSSAEAYPSPREHLETELQMFRLDLFFWTAPNRLSAAVSGESVVFFQGRSLRLRDTALLLGMMMDFQELLPPERLGAGLKRLDTKNYYPSLRSYEEEIRWHFHRLGRAG